MSLKKQLSFLDVFSIATGAMISSGIFLLPGLAFARTGPSVFVSYLLAGVLVSFGMLSQAELVSAMPRAGGDYFFVTRSMGPAMGTVGGLLTWFSLSLKSAFSLVGIGAFASLVLDVDIRLVAVFFCVVFLLINFLGVKEAGRTEIGLVAFLLVLMLFYVVRGLPEVSLQRLEPFAPGGAGAIVSMSGFVFVSYGGLLKVTALAEEVRNPAKTIPQAMTLSLFCVSLLYVLVVLVTAGVLDAELFASSLTPVTDGAGVFAGAFGKAALSVAAILAFLTTANAGIMAASRYPLALSRDGLMPAFLGRVNRRRATPHFSLLVTGAFMVGALFLEIDALVKAASTVLILTYMFTCFAVIILRESKLQNYQPVFRTPLYPALQIAGILGFGALIFEMGTEALGITGALVVAAVAIYLIYGKRRAKGNYALLYLLRRITSKEIAGRDLESELKDIIRERDEIVGDRFDDLVEACPILDLEGPLEAGEFFSIAAGSLSVGLGIPPETLRSLMVRREAESSTAITPFIAIPHLIVEGEGRFSLLMARCASGIRFTDDHPRVRAVFVLAGSRDERNFHLRALSAIAQIVHAPGFEQRWLGAHGVEDLRDAILLGKRKRSE